MNGVLVIVSGFSGAGKGTVIKRLLEKYDNYRLSISATTREKRQGEEDGREYFFRTKEEFEEMIKKDELIEYASYVDNYYGTPKSYVMSEIKSGRDVILEIEMQGALQIKEKMKDTVLVFITPPSAVELKNRLVGRNTEDIETINKRLKRAVDEASFMNSYDYILENDEVEKCVDNLHLIIQSEHFQKIRNIDKINFIEKDLKIFSEGE
jgi:guanylate kinase